MKFRNKKTGKVFNHHSFLFCKENDGNCPNCPIFAKLPKISGHVSTKCNKWVVDHPQEADELMGYEIWEEDMKKPRICEALGVEVMERFKVPGRAIEYYVGANGRIYDERGYCTAFSDFCDAINDNGIVVHIQKWTEQEKQDAKTILRMFGKDNFTHVTKDQGGWPFIMDGDGEDSQTCWFSVGMEKDMFPTLKDGETVLLSDIIGNN